MLVQIENPLIMSSYPIQSDRSKLRPLHLMAWGKCVPEMAQALDLLNDSLINNDFRVTDLYRDQIIQSNERKKYENYIKALNTKPFVFDNLTMRTTYVAKAGYSFHGAGRSVDIDIGSIKDVPKDKVIDLLWDKTKAFGLTPVIDRPDEMAMEAWHFDYLGPWLKVKNRYGYSMAAMGANIVDGGYTGYGLNKDNITLQALLHAKGYDCGRIDGLIGPTTSKAYNRAPGTDLENLPDSLVYI